MKASEMIQRLQQLQAQHGDLDVRIYSEVESEFNDVNEVEPRRILPSQRGTDQERAVPFFGIDHYAIGDYDAQLRYDGDSEKL